MEKQLPSRQTAYRQWYQLPIWKELRAAVLARDCFLCQECLRKGILKPVKEHTTRQDADNQGHADHVKAHNGDWEKFIDMANLETKCGRCHRSKTAKTDGGLGNARK